MDIEKNRTFGVLYSTILLVQIGVLEVLIFWEMYSGYNLYGENEFVVTYGPWLMLFASLNTALVLFGATNWKRLILFGGVSLVLLMVAVMSNFETPRYQTDYVIGDETSYIDESYQAKEYIQNLKRIFVKAAYPDLEPITSEDQTEMFLYKDLRDLDIKVGRTYFKNCVYNCSLDFSDENYTYTVVYKGSDGEKQKGILGSEAFRQSVINLFNSFIIR